MSYLPYSRDHNVSRSSIVILLVRQHGRERQEGPARRNIRQLRKTQRGAGQPFASGFLLGAIAAAGLVKGLLELQSRKAACQKQDVFSWPTIVKAKRK